jgi:hypothetical protein
VVLAPRLGLARLGHVALDGTKLQATRSKHNAMSYGRMRRREAQLKEEIARLVEQAEAQDTAEDQEYGVDSDGSSVAEEVARREARLAKIQAARERLEAEQRAEQGLPEDGPPVIAEQEQRSFADPDARIMLMKRGEYDSASNAQAAVDAESGVIVAAALSNVAPDEGHLPALAAEVRALRDGAEPPEDDLTTMSRSTRQPTPGWWPSWVRGSCWTSCGWPGCSRRRAGASDMSATSQSTSSRRWGPRGAISCR